LQGELSVCFLLSTTTDEHDVGVGRVIKLTALFQLLVGVASEIRVSGELHGRTMRREGLNEDFAFAFTTTSSSSDLREELEGALGGPEVRHVKRKVCVQNTYESDIGEVQPFGNHLGADEDVQFLRPE